MASGNVAPRRAVYTALFGGYENLSIQPRAQSSVVPFICFTDDPTLTSESWDIRVVEPDFPLDSIRSARTIKIVGHEQLVDFDETLWIDNRVVLTGDPDALLNSFLRDSDLTMFEHSFRESVIDEFSAVVNEGYDDPARVYEQLIHYAEIAPQVLDEHPIWTGLIARRHSGPVRETMRQWMAHVLRYSRRDQLSINVALAAGPLQALVLSSESNHLSQWHEWPPLNSALGRNADSRSSQFMHSIRAPLTRVLDLERALRAEKSKSTELASVLESERSTWKDREHDVLAEYEQALRVVDDLREQIGVRDRQLDEARERIDELRRRLRASRKDRARLRERLGLFESSRFASLYERLAVRHSSRGSTVAREQRSGE